MSDVTLARRVVAAMMKKDAFSQWLGIEMLEVDVRRVAVRMTVRPEMLNGFGVCHGGVTFALADTALACACNSTKHVAMSIENTIRYPAPVQAGGPGVLPGPTARPSPTAPPGRAGARCGPGFSPPT